MSTPVELNHAFLGAVMVGNLDKAKEFLECGADVQFEKVCIWIAQTVLSSLPS